MEQQKMKSALYVEKGKLDYSADLKEVPKPASGEVLIKVECAVINPSDLYMMQGNYNGEYEYPLTPGSEASGIVIENGGGLRGWHLVGKRVAFVRKNDKPGKFKTGGAYAEYAITNSWQCIVLPDEVGFEQGACACLNPMSAIGLLDRCQALKA